jgi:hypothetical protein
MATQPTQGDFAEGVRTTPEGPPRDFAEGLEHDPPGPPRDFAEGLEHNPPGPPRDFAEGAEAVGHRARTRIGRGRRGSA